MKYRRKSISCLYEYTKHCVMSYFIETSFQNTSKDLTRLSEQQSPLVLGEEGIQQDLLETRH